MRSSFSAKRCFLCSISHMCAFVDPPRQRPGPVGFAGGAVLGAREAHMEPHHRRGLFGLPAMRGVGVFPAMLCTFVWLFFPLFPSFLLIVFLSPHHRAPGRDIRHCAVPEVSRGEERRAEGRRGPGRTLGVEMYSLNHEPTSDQTSTELNSLYLNLNKFGGLCFVPFFF